MPLPLKQRQVLLQVCAFVLWSLATSVYADVKVDRIHFAADGSLMSSANQLVKSQGDWSGAPTYSVNDVVLYQGVLYICTAPNTNAPPSGNASSWSTFAAQGIQGVPGPAGPQGPVGSQGPQGQAGAGFRWRGPFDSAGAEYEINDVTEYDGSSYIVVDKITNLCDTPQFCTEPVTVMWAKPGSPDEKGWQLVVAQGLRGTTGATGAAGVQGSAGPAGTPGPAGPAGPAGPGLASLDAMGGLPCNVGTLRQGVVEITYGGSANGRDSITMVCQFPVYELVIEYRDYTHVNCGGVSCWTASIASNPSVFSSSFYTSTTNPAPPSAFFQSYNIRQGLTLTLTESGGAELGGDCVGTGSCTMTMNGPKLVTVSR